MKPSFRPISKIFIIGAGIAGLAAGSQLRKYGFEVTILEARDRCGGRICPSDTPGIPFGRGASWIHGTEGNPIVQLAKESHARFMATDRKHFINFDTAGHPMFPADFEAFNKKIDEAFNFAKEYAPVGRKIHSAMALTLTSLLAQAEMITIR